MCQEYGGISGQLRKAAVSFEKDVVFGSELDQFFVLMIVVWVEGDLLQISLRASVAERICVPDLQRE